VPTQSDEETKQDENLLESNLDDIGLTGDAIDHLDGEESTAPSTV